MTSLSLAEIRRRSLATLIPPERLPLSDWIEQNIYLPEEVSALPGAVRLFSYQRAIADAIADPAIERISVMKSARIGYTTVLIGALANFVVNEPSPILALLPVDSDCRDFIVSDVEPTFERSPALAGLLADEADHKKRNTLLYKRFPGGSLKVVAAKSPRNLRRHTVRVLLVDEADAMTPTVEGSPILLAEKRTLSHSTRRIVVGSTPTTEETSNVLKLYRQSDQRVFEIPCPCCGHRFELKWDHIRWPDGEPEQAYAVCPENGCVFEEKNKPAMVDAGVWRATQPEVKRHAGFRINALISNLKNAAWGTLAKEFLQAQQDPDDLRTFYNTVLGLPFSDGEEVDETELLARVERFDLDAVPAEVLVITAGVDVQINRLECTLVGWSRDGVMYILAHRIILISPDDDDSWAELDQLLRERWTHPFGGTIGVDAAVVDSGAFTDRVYAYCFPRSRRHIWAGKGIAGSRASFALTQHKSKAGRLAQIGVDTIKSTLISRLSRPNLIHFSDSLDAAFFEQLTSEKKVTRYRRGAPYHYFERIKGKRAEALDCAVYAMAARQSVNLSLNVREESLRGNPLPGPTRPTVSRSKFMDRGREL